ncbi:chloramphenicol phosphotransferase CPT [Plantactinospora sonchi]|uniref:Chloramphenicol phosphotransferase CPT n=1 Tax=Plantactinospora sonchi TaxID=1544735 RepID=A0ABU7RNQ1_9ACTN
MAVQVIMLNGGSSSGKSGIARCLQAILPDPWLVLGIDTLIRVIPPAMRTTREGVVVDPDGVVQVGPQFEAAEAAWRAGIAAMARAGARVISDDVFLTGAVYQQRWRQALAGLDVLWVGVRCASEVAVGREIARGDRPRGMATSEAETVHRGVVYDLELDTTHSESLDCARVVAARLG